MSYDITVLHKEHACISILHAGWDTPEAVAQHAQAFEDVLAATECPLFFIVDMSQVPITVEGVIRSANQMARGPNAPLHHPMCKGVALVTAERIAQLIARGLQTETFGNLNVRVCDSVEEALTHA